MESFRIDDLLMVSFSIYMGASLKMSSASFVAPSVSCKIRLRISVRKSQSLIHISRRLWHPPGTPPFDLWEFERIVMHKLYTSQLQHLIDILTLYPSIDISFNLSTSEHR